LKKKGNVKMRLTEAMEIVLELAQQNVIIPDYHDESEIDMEIEQEQACAVVDRYLQKLVQEETDIPC